MQDTSRSADPEKRYATKLSICCPCIQPEPRQGLEKQMTHLPALCKYNWSCSFGPKSKSPGIPNPDRRDEAKVEMQASDVWRKTGISGADGSSPESIHRQDCSGTLQLGHSDGRAPLVAQKLNHKLHNIIAVDCMHCHLCARVEGDAAVHRMQCQCYVGCFKQGNIADAD